MYINTDDDILPDEIIQEDNQKAWIAHDAKDIEVVHLAISDESRDEMTLREYNELQSALIIQADTSEPSHFMQCIEERLCSFVRNPTILKESLDTPELSRWRTFMGDQKCIFKKVDLVNETNFCNLEPAVMRSFLRGYNIVFFTLYSGTYERGYDPLVTGVINDLINRGELSVVFLRGSGHSVPMKLGFVRRKSSDDGYVEYADGNYIELLVENINQLENQSLTIFLNKFTKLESRIQTIGELEETIENCLKLEDSYICGVCDTTLKKSDEWHFLARSVNERSKYPWAIHKTKKVMFTPWYGYSHGNENQCLLTLYALRYLLHEHMKHFQSINTFRANLFAKTTNNQLSNIAFDFIE